MIIYKTITSKHGNSIVTVKQTNVLDEGRSDPYVEITTRQASLHLNAKDYSALVEAIREMEGI